VFLDYLNNYKAQKHKHHLLVVTSTYGLGEAPANANKFLKKLNKAKHVISFDFSVLGFGSRNYPDFCQFAIDVDQALMNESNATKNTDIGLVNQQSKLDFDTWKGQWCINNGLSNSDVKIEEKTKYDEFEVCSITNADLHPKLTFRLVLKADRNIEFVSGDLLAIRPKKGEQERLYSIGAGPNHEIVLYIKKHFLGTCSQQLASLSQNSKIEARIVSNTKFHAPQGYPSLILVSNGTGIAPFIGIAVENKSNANIDLFWGGKSAEDYKLYEEELLGLKANNQIRNLRTIFSLDKNQYVQQLITENQAEIAEALVNGTSIMICGSIAMGHGVLNEIGMVCKNNNLSDIEFYKDNGQIKMDCY
jgi:sulfite reductase (NADPH) flavoprotein alpha-component